MCREDINKKIVFLIPPVSMRELFGDFGDAGNVLPFVGVMLLAALTRERGYKTELIDSVALRLNAQDVINRLMEINPDYIGMTASTQTISQAAKMTELIKASLPGSKIIIGGPHVSAVPDKTLEKYSYFDIGVIGEGEETLLEILRFYDEGCQNLGAIKGIIYRGKDGKTLKTPQRPLIENLDAYPMPAWDLLPDLKTYYRPSAENMNRLPAVNMMVSRGCPMKCTFCFNRMDPRNRRVRWYSAERIMSEIEMLVKEFGVREISFFDDNMLANKKLLSQLCERLIDARLDLTWNCYGSANYADEKLFRLMRKAGCWQISWGVEHGRQEILDVYSKGIRISKMTNALREAKRSGLRNRAFMMHGNFLETKETVEDNIKYLNSLPVEDFHATFFTPLPGTIAYDEVEKYGKWLKDPEIWENYACYTTSIFLPRDMEEKELVESFSRIYRKFYFRPRVFLYFALKMLRNPNTMAHITKTAFRFIKVFGKKKAKQ